MRGSGTARVRLRRVCLGAIALLYVASVPWYRDPGAPLRLWLGLPDWVAIALLCYVGVAVLNGVAWLATEVTDPPGTTSDASGPGDAQGDGTRGALAVRERGR